MALRTVSPVLLYYFLDHLDLFGAMPDFRFKFGLMALQSIALFAGKILLMAGAMEAVALIIRRKTDLFSKKTFIAGIRSHALFVGGISTVPAIIHLSLYLISGRFLPFGIVTAFTDVPLLLLIAYRVTSRKGEGSAAPLGLLEMAIVCLAYSLSVFISLANLTWTTGISFLNPSLGFAATLLKWWVMIFAIQCFSRNQMPPPSEERQLILINPPFSGTVQALGSLLLWLYPPVFLVIRSLTPSRYRIREFNRVQWNNDFYQGNALVAITCLTSNSAEAYKIAKEFKARGAKVVMGGPHVTIFPDEALEFCDSVVIGPVESAWDEVIQDYENQALRPYYERIPLDTDVQRTRSFLRSQPPHAITDFIETRRGCKFKCYFCANSGLQKGTLPVAFPIEDMIALLKNVTATHKHINFIDTNIYSDPAYTKALLEAMIPMRVRWNASASIDIAADDKMLELLKKSGCAGLLIGYEIPEDSGEADKGGKLALANRYVELTRKLKKAKIPIKAHFIYGFENDNLKSLFKLWLFCRKLWPNTTIISFLTPIPGSAFFKEILSQDRIKDINWRNYNLHTLVYDNPLLDNFFFRKAFLWLMLFFLGTTSSLGVWLITMTTLVIALVHVFGI